MPVGKPPVFIGKVTLAKTEHSTVVGRMTAFTGKLALAVGRPPMFAGKVTVFKTEAAMCVGKLTRLFYPRQLVNQRLTNSTAVSRRNFRAPSNSLAILFSIVGSE